MSTGPDARFPDLLDCIGQFTPQLSQEIGTSCGRRILRSLSADQDDRRSKRVRANADRPTTPLSSNRPSPVNDESGIDNGLQERGPASGNDTFLR